MLEGQEDGLAHLAAAGFAVADVVRAYALLYNFTVGFCIEEQAVVQTAAVGDDRYSLERRAGRLNRDTHPHVVAAGPHIFGDPDERFADLVAVIVDAAGRMRRTGTATEA